MPSHRPSTGRFVRMTPDARRARNTELLEELHGAVPLTGPRADELREELVLTNAEVAVALARRFRGRGMDLDDLEQVAYVALLRAARRYEADRGIEFLVYAVPTIVGHLKCHFRDHGWVIRVPRRIQETQRRLEDDDAAPAVGDRYDNARLERLADLTGVSADQVNAALVARGCFTPASLDIEVGASGGARLADLLPADSSQIDAVDARLMLEPLWDGLSRRDKRVLRLRYYEERTQREIGEDLGVSQVQVSRILARIHLDLRRRLTDLPEAA